MSGFIDYLEKNFSYYNAPEGEDPAGKIIGLGKYGFFAGSFLAIYDAGLWSHCRNTLQFLNTAAYWVIPMTGICVTFSAVTYSLTNLRKKDDKWNYFAGSLAASAVLYTWRRNIRMDAWFGIAMTSYALIKKTNIQDGRGSNVFAPTGDPAKLRKWVFPWRNSEKRNYSSKPWWPHNKTDYYIHHY